MTNPLERTKGEPKKANRRLQIYANFKGNLPQFEKHLAKKYPDLSVKYSTLDREAAQWKWTRRIGEYKEQQERKLIQEIEETFNELNYEGILDMKDFIKDINELRNDVMRRWRNEEITSTTALKNLKDYIEHYRQATEIYYINSRHNIQPIEAEVKTEVKHTGLSDVRRELIQK